MHLPQTPSNAIAICGAGLAGSACAIRLAQLGNLVVLLDQATFPRKKLCGEFLGPDAMPVLADLNVLELVAENSYLPVRNIHISASSGKTLSVKTAWFRKDHPYALAISRDKLDTLLLQYAEQMGVTVLQNTRVLSCATEDESLFTLALEENQQLVSKFLVDASGRHSRLAATESQPASPEKASIAAKHVGLQCHVLHQSDSSDLRMFFFQGGYGGLQPISETQSNLCMWVEPYLAKDGYHQPQKLFEETMLKNPVARKMMDSIEPDGAIETVSNLRHLNDGTATRRFFSIGDARLTVEPFSGFGMAHALKSGYVAADYIDAGLKAGLSYRQIKQQYSGWYRNTFHRHLNVLKWTQPFLYRHRLHNAVWPLLPPVLPLLTRLYR